MGYVFTVYLCSRYFCAPLLVIGCELRSLMVGDWIAMQLFRCDTSPATTEASPNVKTRGSVFTNFTHASVISFLKRRNYEIFRWHKIWSWAFWYLHALQWSCLLCSCYKPVAVHVFLPPSPHTNLEDEQHASVRVIVTGSGRRFDVKFVSSCAWQHSCL